MAKESELLGAEELHAMIETCKAKLKLERPAMAKVWENRMLAACHNLEQLHPQITPPNGLADASKNLESDKPLTDGQQASPN